MVITGQNGNYETLRLLGKDGHMNYHICRDTAGNWHILAIATDTTQNAVVDRVEYLLRQLAEKSEKYEQEHAEQTGSDRRVHYDWLFPQVIDRLTLHEQNNRKVIVLSFLDANLQKSFALMQITERKQRVDLKSSAWMMGRLLKLLAFLYESNVMAPILTSNFLLEPDNHRLLMLNWTTATLGDVPTPAQQGFVIKQAAECILLLLGAEYYDGAWHYQYPLEEGEMQYIKCLQSLHRGDYTDALQAHAAFYETVDSLWGKKFHPFTTYSISD